MKLLDLVNHKGRLIALVVTGEEGYLLASSAIGPKVLGRAIGVLRDDGICSREDVLGGAIVLLQKYRLGSREVPLKLGDVSYVRTPEGVDGLVAIAHHSQICRWHNLTGFLVHELVLGWKRSGELSN